MPQTQIIWPDDDAPVQPSAAAQRPALRFPEPARPERERDMPPALAEELSLILAEALVQEFRDEAIRKSAFPSGLTYRPDLLDGPDPLDGRE
jgi:hypothetical protein